MISRSEVTVQIFFSLSLKNCSFYLLNPGRPKFLISPKRLGVIISTSLFSLLITRICVCTRKRSLNRFTLSLSLMSMYHIYGLKFQWLFFPFYVVIIDFKFCLILLCWLGFVSSHSFRFFCFVWFRFDCFRGFFVSILFSTWHEPLNPGLVNNTSRHYLVNRISLQYSI